MYVILALMVPSYGGCSRLGWICINFDLFWSATFIKYMADIDRSCRTRTSTLYTTLQSVKPHER